RRHLLHGNSERSDRGNGCGEAGLAEAGRPGILQRREVRRAAFLASGIASLTSARPVRPTGNGPNALPPIANEPMDAAATSAKRPIRAGIVLIAVVASIAALWLAREIVLLSFLGVLIAVVFS